MMTTILVFIWALISMYAVINVSALMTIGKARIMSKCVKEWKRRGEYEKGEEFDMMFFSLPTAVLVSSLCIIPVFHVLMALPFATGRTELLQKFITRIDEVKVE